MSGKQWYTWRNTSATTVAWGNITGTLTDQVDLNATLATKANDASVVHLTGTETLTGKKNFQWWAYYDATGWVIGTQYFNLWDPSATNYESYNLWRSWGTFWVTSVIWGSWVHRNFQITANSRTFSFRPSQNAIFEFNWSWSATLTQLLRATFSTSASTAVTFQWLILDPTVSQSWTAWFRILDVNPTVSTLGSWEDTIWRFASNSVNKFQVTHAWNVNVWSQAADYHQFVWGTGTVTYNAVGSSTNINMNIVPKGTGRLQAWWVNVMTISSTDTVTNKIFSNNTRIVWSTQTASPTLSTSANVTQYIDATTWPLTVTLPAVANWQWYKIYKIDSTANAVTIVRAWSDTINGGTSVVLTAQYSWYELLWWGGTNWLAEYMQPTASSGWTPGWSSTQLQYNNAGAFWGVTGATTNGTTLTLTSPIITTSITTWSATLSVFDATATTVTEFAAATTYTIWGTPTTAITANFFANATATATTKTINFGTGWASGSTTAINIWSATSGATTNVKINITPASDAANDMYYRNASWFLTRLAMGTTGQFLAANTGAAPTWWSPTVADVGAKATQATGTTWVFGAYFVLAFDSEAYDTSTIHDNVTNNSRLTAPSTWKYIVEWSVWNSPNYKNLKIRKNGTTDLKVQWQWSSSTSSGTDAWCINVVWIWSLAATDYVELLCYSTSNTVTTIANTEFTIQKLA